jgi:hypothetical protein
MGFQSQPAEDNLLADAVKSETPNVVQVDLDSGSTPTTTGKKKKKKGKKGSKDQAGDEGDDPEEIKLVDLQEYERKMELKI